MSPSMAFPRPKKLYIVFGEPIYMEKLPAELDERGKRKYILDRIDEFYVRMEEEDKKKYGGKRKGRHDRDDKDRRYHKDRHDKGWYQG